MTLPHYAFIKANWHSDIVDRALDGFAQAVPLDQIDVFDTPGAFEMPLLARSRPIRALCGDCGGGLCGGWRHLSP